MSSNHGFTWVSNCTLSFYQPSSIGYAIAEGLAENGAKVVISSRKEDHVEHAVKKLKERNLEVSGCVCHVGNDRDRKGLLQKV